jgi:hypothetical protein
MGPVPELLRELGLLDWSTVLVGYRRGLIDARDVSEVAVQAVIESVNEVGCELAALTSAGALSGPDVDDALVGLAGSEPTTSHDTAVRRWLLGRLVQLQRAELADDERLDVLQEVYAEFGFPEELRFVSRYNLTVDERAVRPSVGDQLVSPIDGLRMAVARLRAELLVGPVS